MEQPLDDSINVNSLPSEGLLTQTLCAYGIFNNFELVFCGFYETNNQKHFK